MSTAMTRMQRNATRWSRDSMRQASRSSSISTKGDSHEAERRMVASRMHRRQFTTTVAGALAGATLSSSPLAALSRVRMSNTLDAARLNARLKELSAFGANPQGGVSRVAYSDADKAGRI